VIPIPKKTTDLTELFGKLITHLDTVVKCLTKLGEDMDSLEHRVESLETSSKQIAQELDDMRKEKLYGGRI
jgi:uncharacterized protein YdcH (DUF465 family)